MKKGYHPTVAQGHRSLFLECANLVSSLSLSVGLKCLSFPDLKASGEKKEGLLEGRTTKTQASAHHQKLFMMPPSYSRRPHNLVAPRRRRWSEKLFAKLGTQLNLFSLNHKTRPSSCCKAFFENQSFSSGGGRNTFWQLCGSECFVQIGILRVYDFHV